jgi:hypothetical protein
MRAALVPVRGRARRLRTVAAAIARELEPGRQLARDRGVFLFWAGPAWDTARLVAAVPPAAPPARQPPTPRAWASEARRPAWRGMGRTGARHAAQRSSLKGAAPAGRLWLFVARGPGRPEGVAPVTRPAGTAAPKEKAVVAFRAPGTATFRSRPA